MASSRIPGPINTSIAHAAFSGAVSRISPSLSGPTGLSPTTSGRNNAFACSVTGAPAATDQWIRLTAGTFESLPKSSDRLVRSFRIALAAESDAGDNRLVFKTRAEASKAAATLAAYPVAAAQLCVLGGISDTRLVIWTAAELYAGNVKILWRDRGCFIGSPTAAPSSSRPSRPASPQPPAPRPGPAPSPKTPAPSTFPPGLDAVAVAAILKQAAKNGTPFCEQCMKSQAAQKSAAAGAV